MRKTIFIYILGLFAGEDGCFGLIPKESEDYRIDVKLS